MSNIINVVLKEVRPNPVALRTVNKKSEGYLGLVASIRKLGFTSVITVRETTDEETGEAFFELVDGLHRYTAALDAGLEEVPAKVTDFDESKTLEAQVMMNVHKIETKPVEYSRQLVRILVKNPMLTKAELAANLGKSTAWLDKVLGLSKIESDTLKSLIDDGTIKATNAYALSKLPSDEMASFSDRAQTMAPDQFTSLVNQRVKEIKDARRQGKEAKEEEFQPVAFMQKLSDIKNEFDNNEVCNVICEGLTTPKEGFRSAIEWILHLDNASVAVQQASFEEKKAARTEAKKKRTAAKAKKKAEAAEKAAKKSAESAAAAEEELASLA